VKTLPIFRALFVAGCLVAGSGAVRAAGASFDDELAAIQRDWAAAKYETPGKHERAAAFSALADRASKLSAANPQRVEAAAWEGIVLSTYAGEVSPLSAMKYAKAAREALERAERIDPAALHGGVYASLGALYSKVPGGFMGFGDDERAAEYFRKALAVDPDNIDNNFFYGEFLVDQGDYVQAVTVLNHALEAPTVENRPVFDAGRRAEIRALLTTAQRKTS
jgi:tetratricopeptide (TPR) repeat protein